MVTFTKKLLLAIISLYSILLPVSATLYEYVADYPNIWYIITSILPILFLFLLLFGLFAIPLNVMKSRFHLADKVVYLLAGILAAIGTYYGRMNELMWAFWESLFLSGIFIVAIIVMVGALFILIGMVAKARAYTAEGRAELAEKRGKMFKQIGERETARAAMEEQKAAAREKRAEFAIGRTRQFVRGVRDWWRAAKGRLPLRELRKEIPAKIEWLHEARVLVRDALQNEGIAEKQTMIAYRKTRTAAKEILGEVKVRRAARGIGKNEERRLIKLGNRLNRLIKQSRQARAVFKDIDREIDKAEKLYVEAEEAPAEVAYRALDKASVLLGNAERWIVESEEIIENRRKINLEVANLLRKTRLLEGEAEKIEEKKEGTGGFFKKGKTFRGFK